MTPDVTQRSILVLAAHPDDEVLGCGGSLARFANEGAAIHVAFLADGVTARGEGATQSAEERRARRAAAEKACAILGAASTWFGDFPDNRLDTVGLLAIVKPIEALIVRHRPDTVFTHHAGDVNVDHRCVHQAAITACRPQPSHCVRTLLSFEVPSSTEWQPSASGPVFAPDWFIDISATLDRKIAALGAYAAEVREWPHPRSREGVMHLARWRGATVGLDAAEAFVLGRLIS